MKIAITDLIDRMPLIKLIVSSGNAYGDDAFIYYAESLFVSNLIIDVLFK